MFVIIMLCVIPSPLIFFSWQVRISQIHLPFGSDSLGFTFGDTCALFKKKNLQIRLKIILCLPPLLNGAL